MLANIRPAALPCFPGRAGQVGGIQDAVEQKILHKHVNDLPAGVITKPPPERTSAVSPCHSDINSFILGKDHIDTWCVGHDRPVGQAH